MKCNSCQFMAPSDAAFCTKCGAAMSQEPSPAQVTGQTQEPSPAQVTGRTQEPSPAQVTGRTQEPSPAQVGQTAATAHAGPSFRLDLRRLSRAEQIIGAACLLVIIASFIPWFGFSEAGQFGQQGFSYSENGVNGHGYLVIALLVALGLTGYLVLRAGWDVLPVRLPVARAPLLLVGTALQLLIILIAFLAKPAGLGWEAGAYLELAAAITACSVIAIPAVRTWSATRQ